MSSASDPLRHAAALAAPVAAKASLALPLTALAAALAWAAAAGISLTLEDLGDWYRTWHFAIGCAAIAVLIAGWALVAPGGRDGEGWLQRRAPWLLALGVFFSAWELFTAKLGTLPQPFFPPPQALLEVYTDDWGKLGASVLASVKLQLTGCAIGAVIGFLTGLAMGWSKQASYWVHPLIRFVGPLPATAWLPIAFFIFPSSWSASIFLIALATGFPVAVLTWSGVANVDSVYYDVARTLGASNRFLILKVAIPAAMPHVFVGLFMGFAASFAVLVVAEMLGVKAGLGWYLQWAQGWASYANMYAALVVMSLLCSGAITLLFRVRDRLLSWQKGAVQW